jgi:hypothetical protein
MGKRGSVSFALTEEAKLKRSIRRHFTNLGFRKDDEGALVLPDNSKATVRKLHRRQREEKLGSNKTFLEKKFSKIEKFFANGDEIDPGKIALQLKLVKTGTIEADIFRAASLTWSVPVSNGYGRRLRYLVWDKGHDRLVGIFALGDPVFNLGVRDELIGWNSEDRKKRLVNILDAYVLGAVPPYNMLLGGKAVACLIRTREVYNDFRRTYGKTTGIISKEQKAARLLAVTTTSSMGRSSIYNRLKLGSQQYFEPIGYTLGFGHFHITDAIFTKMRDYMRISEHPYVDEHKFGDGPNWRMRTIRVALSALGINQSVLKHGIQRQVFICLMTDNSVNYLKTGKGSLGLSSLKTVDEVSELVVARWMLPRSQRKPDYQLWQRKFIRPLIKTGKAKNLSSQIKNVSKWSQ